jgi:tetratricopeptide (TPR) repeat protein
MLQQGLALHQTGRGEEAATLYEHVLRVEPGHAEANHLLGLARLQQGDASAAVQHIAMSLKAQPSNPQYLSNIGVALIRAGRNEEAAEVLGRAVSINPTSAEMYSNLGMANRALGRFREAADAYRHAAAIKPEEAAFHHRLAGALRHFGDHLGAEASFRRALGLRPDNVEAYDRLAFILIDQGRTAEAIDLLDGALTILPQEATLHLRRSAALYVQGEIDRAVEGFDQAIALRPTFGEAHLHRATTVRYRQRDRSVEAMAGVFRSQDVSIGDRIFAGFALGKVLRDVGDHSGSISTFVEVNRMQRQRVSFSLESEVGLMRSDVDRFRNVDESVLSAKSTTASPIFIVGLPRSGKSTLELILSSQASLAGAGELPTMGRLARELIREADGSPFSALPAERFAELGRMYMQEAGNLVPAGHRIIDTMPANYYYLGFIRLALPNARVVHCIRPTADHRVAIFEKLLTGSGHEYSNNLHELCGYHSAYSGMMSKWQARFPGFIHEIDVEAWSDRPAVWKSLLHFCGLDSSIPGLSWTQSEPQRGDWSTDERAANHSAHMAAWKEVHPELWT